jgi:hypothetical protein
VPRGTGEAAEIVWEEPTVHTAVKGVVRAEPSTVKKPEPVKGLEVILIVTVATTKLAVIVPGPLIVAVVDEAEGLAIGIEAGLLHEENL